jgi:hypothetical protein
MRIIRILILVFFISSCNKALLINKKDIIYYQKGYITFYYDHWTEGIFFPWNDTIDNNFLSQNHLNGFKLDRDDLNYFRELAVAKTIQQPNSRNDKIEFIDDSIKLLPVEISYYWGDVWKLRKQKSQQVNIKYTFQGKEINLLYTIYDNRHILWIHPLKRG